MVKLTPAQTIPARLQRRGSAEGVEMREGEGSKTTFPCENANRHLQTLRVRSVSQFHARSQNISSLRVLFLLKLVLTEALTTANPGQFLVLSCSLFSLEQNEEFRLCLLYHKCALSDVDWESHFSPVILSGHCEKGGLHRPSVTASYG